MAAKKIAIAAATSELWRSVMSTLVWILAAVTLLVGVVFVVLYALRQIGKAIGKLDLLMQTIPEGDDIVVVRLMRTL